MTGRPQSHTPPLRRTLRECLIDFEMTREAVLANTVAGPVAGTVTEVGIDFVNLETVDSDGDAADVAVALFYVVTVRGLGGQQPPPAEASGLATPR